MDDLYGSDTLITYQMIQERQIEMADFARKEHLLRFARTGQSSWICRIMTRLGDAMVLSGTWLKSHYSTPSSYLTR